jgi:hypothetical protein
VAKRELLKKWKKKNAKCINFRALVKTIDYGIFFMTYDYCTERDTDFRNGFYIIKKSGNVSGWNAR